MTDNLKNLYVSDDFDHTQKWTAGFDYDKYNAGTLDLSELNIEVDIANIDQYPNQEYALLRKNGLGTSDSSIALGVNPYKTKSDLIAEKCRNYLTEDELAVGDKSAVRKGRELEPLIIYKHSQIMDRHVIKPIDMYRHKDYPYIKFNFDGVIDKLYNDDGTYQYIPDEIKVVTIFGMKHYKPKQATFSEYTGWRIIPPHYEEENVSIETKADLYGIPPYYYTQLQQQIFGLNAPYGFLTVLFERDWQIHSWFVWRDQKVINQLILEDTKVWDIIEQKRPAGFDLGVKIRS
jgi:predicted phage-related endonuclease